MGNNFTRLDDEDPPCLCEFGNLMTVFEDLKAKPTLQLEYLFTECGLGHVQPFGCS
jgi:hypothetical protein